MDRGLFLAQPPGDTCPPDLLAELLKLIPGVTHIDTLPVTPRNIYLILVTYIGVILLILPPRVAA